MPRYEQPSTTVDRRALTLEYRRREGLKKLTKYVRVFVMAGIIGNLGGGGLRYGLEKVIEKKYQAQYEQIVNAEAEAKELFGDNWVSSSEKAKQIIKQKKRNTTNEGLRLLFGAKPDDLLSVDSSAHEPETEKTEKTFVGSIATEEGWLDANIVERIVQETFPKGWINNEIERIEFQEKEVDLHYKGVKSATLAVCYRNGRLGDKKKAEIIFYKAAEYDPSYYIVNTLGHEVAHANDWESDNEMTAEEKTVLAVKIGQRLEAKDRFMSSYVELIKYENDEKRTRYYKAVEYWAEICAQFFEDARKLHIKDYRIVADHVRKTDPNFNWIKATKTRQELIFQWALGQSQNIEQGGATENTINSSNHQQ